MYQGSPKDVTTYLNKIGRKVPSGENSIEYLIDVIQEYDQSEIGVVALAEFARTGVKPPKLAEGDVSVVSTAVAMQTPARTPQRGDAVDGEFDHSLRSPYNPASRSSWSASHSGVVQKLKFSSPRPISNVQPRLQIPSRTFKSRSFLQDLLEHLLERWS